MIEWGSRQRGGNRVGARAEEPIRRRAADIGAGDPTRCRRAGGISSAPDIIRVERNRYDDPESGGRGVAPEIDRGVSNIAQTGVIENADTIENGPACEKRAIWNAVIIRID